MFNSGTTSFGGTSNFGGFGGVSTGNTLGLGNQDNPMKDIEVHSPPDDTVSAVRFSPKADFLIASSWANDVSITLSCITMFIAIAKHVDELN
jgi:hypothetical protein